MVMRVLKIVLTKLILFSFLTTTPYLSMATPVNPSCSSVFEAGLLNDQLVQEAELIAPAGTLDFKVTKADTSTADRWATYPELLNSRVRDAQGKEEVEYFTYTIDSRATTPRSTVNS
jgi:hypothetical protein